MGGRNVNNWARRFLLGVLLILGPLCSAHAGYVDGNPLSYTDPLGLAVKCKTVAKIPLVGDLQECVEDGTTPTEQEAKSAKRMTDRELQRACNANGYDDAHALKKNLNLDAKSDIFVDRNGNMYSGPRKGTGIPQYLHMNTRGIVPKP
jgi:hypothetical protein